MLKNPILMTFVLVFFASVASGQESDAGVGLRQLVVASEADAMEIRRRVVDGGEAFDLLAAERSIDPASAAYGGFMGRIRIDDLRREFQEALEAASPGDVTRPIPVGDAYFLFQILSEAESAWLDAEKSGVEALERGATSEAVSSLESAVEIARDSWGGTDPRVVRSQGLLADAYRFDARFVDAEAVYREALETIEASGDEAFTDLDRAQIFNGLGLSLVAQERFDEAREAYGRAERLRVGVHGPDHPEVSAVRQNVADLLAFEGDLLAAARKYDSAVSSIEAALGPNDPAAIASRERFAAFRRALIPDVLDRVSELVAWVDFQDELFDTRVDELVELVALAPLTELGYTQIRAALLQAAISEPTERILELGLERFPDSRVLRVHLADLYSGTGRTQEGLRMLEEASRLPRPEGTDPVADVQQRAFIFERIGDMHLALFNYDEAIAAYERIIDVDPTASAGHKKLGIAYVATSRLEEAVVQFEEAAIDAPDDPSIPLEIAETLLSMGRAGDAVLAADRAIELGTTDPSVLFIRGRALVVDGHVEEGRAQIEEYQQIDTELRAEETRTRNIDAIANRALEAFRSDDPSTALELLKEGIGTYPEAERLNMAVGVILGRSGRHAEAVAHYENLLASGIGRPFLLHLQLAEQYAAMGDEESGQRHREIYEQTRESELVVFAPE